MKFLNREKLGKDAYGEEFSERKVGQLEGAIVGVFVTIGSLGLAVWLGEIAKYLI